MRIFRSKIRDWRYQLFSVIMWDCGHTADNHQIIGYQLNDHGYNDKDPIIFTGDDYQLGIGADPLSYSALFGLLHFLTLREGDTDKEYFNEYTQRQKDWRDSRRCDDLRMILLELEDTGHG